MIKIVYVELVCNICNAKCVWCHLNYKCSQKMKMGMMYFDDFKKFIDLNKDFPMRLRLLMNGESLLHPSFPDIVQYALDNNVELGCFITNLSIPNLPPETFIALAKHPRIIVNFGGGTPETHLLNTHTNLDVVLHNLFMLIYAKEKVNPDLKIVAKMVINKNNAHEKTALTNLVKEFDSDIKTKFSRVTFHGGREPDDTLLFARRNLLGADDTDLSLLSGRRHKMRFDDGVLRVDAVRTTCEGGYFAVRFDGAIQCCCNVWYHDGVIGNAFETPLAEIEKTNAWKKCQEDVKNLIYVERCKDC